MPNFSCLNESGKLAYLLLGMKTANQKSKKIEKLSTFAIVFNVGVLLLLILLLFLYRVFQKKRTKN